MWSSVKSLKRAAIIPSLCARNSSYIAPKSAWIDPDRIINDGESHRKGIPLNRLGYKNYIMEKGFLPRDPEEKRPLISQPTYKPKKSWSPKRAYFGQNDYIDILGDGNARPTDSMRGVPAWLRGFQGNEYQMLLLKRQRFHHWKSLRPKKFHEMNLRIKWLYARMNFKTPN